ncbi:hypothetical protein PHLGIDRAFT_67712 [Phlebiopsis gigantea 11061_1 CR5-6]|uniref:Sucraseferredoxin-like protein n=1 Tax=Phlebiopsis gigantea (strain 11061_1 CR5-6) TaxID=745531 RepID=A0A0C3SD46_PHLG1|nr:hypothetical protein PHLGIDRAFT_67712 [Phlebiopsis gigantea 11061_1 CR5-6]
MSSASPTEPLAGTVGYHNTYILLHTRVPPPLFPAKVSSKLQRALMLRTIRWGGNVNLAWLPEDGEYRGSTTPEWEDPEREAYRVSAFSVHRGYLDIPQLSMENIDEVAETLQRHSQRPEGMGADILATSPLYFYVCTHGERDCRCRDTGSAVFAALQQEVKKHNLGDTVKVGGVGHVGGHKYAANVLVFPYGDWLGNIKPEHVPELVARMCRPRSKLQFNPLNSPPIHSENLWRGRMGLDKEEQKRLVGSGEPKTIETSLSPHPSRS